MMGLWRCQNSACSTDPHGRLIFDFESDVPVCPSCNCDGRKPEFASLIIKREVIHYDPPHPKIGNRGTGHIACSPKRSVAGLMASAEVFSVNCSKCKVTQVYQDNLPEDAPRVTEDVVFKVDPKTMKVVHETLGEEISEQEPEDQNYPEAGCCG